jgi:chromosome partitioning protein
MSIVAVFNQKGGVGKTTTCLNVAASLAMLGRNPLAIDLDPQSHLTLACGIKGVVPTDSISAFFIENKPLADLVRRLANNMRVIPAHPELAKIDALYGKSTSIAKKLDEGLQVSLAQDETPVLIDCCPMLGVLSLNAVFAADRVLIPVSADFLSLQGAHRLDVALKVLEGPLKRRIERRIVVTRFDARRRLSHEIYDKLKEHFGDAVCDTRITESVGLAESPARGQDIFSFAPHSKGAQDYGALTMELLTKGFFQ